MLAAAHPDAAARAPTCGARARTAARRPGSAPRARRPRRSAPRRRRRLGGSSAAGASSLAEDLRAPGPGPRPRRRSSGRRRRTSGFTPLPRIEVPSAVRYSPTVRSSAPPAVELDHLLEGPLAEGPGADDLGEVVLLQRRGEDLGRRGGVAVDQDDDRRAGRARRRRPRSRARPGCGSRSRRRRRPRGRRWAEHRLVEQAAAVAAQVEHEALGAAAVEALDLLAQLAVGALAEGGEPHVADLLAVDVAADRPRTAGTRTSARSSVERRGACRRRPGRSAARPRSRAGPLIRAVETSEGTPAIDSPSTATITSPSSIPARSAGVSGKTLATRSPAWTSVTVSPTPEKRPEVAALKRLELLGVEVVGEAVVVAPAQLLDHRRRSRRRRASPRSGSRK